VRRYDGRKECLKSQLILAENTQRKNHPPAREKREKREGYLDCLRSHRRDGPSGGGGTFFIARERGRLKGPGKKNNVTLFADTLLMTDTWQFGRAEEWLCAWRVLPILLGHGRSKGVV